MISSFEKISKIVPIVSLLIVFSSIVKNQIYYESSGININEFINLSEFPILFINDLKFYLFYIFSLIMLLPFIYVRTYFRNKYGEKNFTFSKTKMFSKAIIIGMIGSIILTLFNDTDLTIKLTLIQSNIIMIFAATL